MLMITMIDMILMIIIGVDKTYDKLLIICLFIFIVSN